MAELGIEDAVRALEDWRYEQKVKTPDYTFVVEFGELPIVVDAEVVEALLELRADAGDALEVVGLAARRACRGAPPASRHHAPLSRRQMPGVAPPSSRRGP